MITTVNEVTNKISTIKNLGINRLKECTNLQVAVPFTTVHVPPFWQVDTVGQDDNAVGKKQIPLYIYIYKRELKLKQLE